MGFSSVMRADLLLTMAALVDAVGCCGGWPLAGIVKRRNLSPARAHRESKPRRHQSPR